MIRLNGLLLTFFAMFAKHEAARILAVYPIPSFSHQVVFRPLMVELAKRGHDVVVLTTDPIYKDGKSPANFTEIDVHDRSYEAWRENFLAEAVTNGAAADQVSQILVGFRTTNKVFEMQLKTPEMQNLIRKESDKFDLLITEACATVALGLSHIFKVPVIQINSFGAFPTNVWTMGMPFNPLVHPTSNRQRLNNLSKWDKLMELYNHYNFESSLDIIEKEADIILKEVLGSDTPPLSELKKNVEMLFVNVHPIWEMNRPTPPNVIYMGGVHQKPVNDLPQDLKSYLDSSKNGVIYVSFGTNVEPSHLPQERLQKIINVFSKLPYDILWKWNKDEMPGRPKNVKLSKWLPQSDLLRHPKVKLFIMQGGLQSTDEAITAGVPMIGIPMLGDQWYNIELYVYHKIGLRQDLETLTEEGFANAINTILNNESDYRKNVAKLRTLMRDQPETPLDRAVWWTEYVIRHSGAAHLKSPSANMSIYEYYELELVAYLLFGFLAVILSAVWLCYTLFKIITNKSSVKAKRS